jgi:hypothetical protein
MSDLSPAEPASIHPTTCNEFKVKVSDLDDEWEYEKWSITNAGAWNWSKQKVSEQDYIQDYG